MTYDGIRTVCADPSQAQDDAVTASSRSLSTHLVAALTLSESGGGASGHNA